MNQETPHQKIERLESVLRATIPALWMLKFYFEHLIATNEDEQDRANDLAEELEKTARKFEDHLNK